MKKIITLDIYIRIRLCCLFAFVVLAQILPAWNYLKVYRNDGVEPLELYSVDVDSLVCSKIGIDSIMYADWQVQEIWTPDTIYRIPLAIIDSIQFKTVDTNIAVKNVVTASKQISQFFVNSDNLQDFATHLGEIKDFEQVEDAWMHGTSLFVKVRDWGTISFSYPIPNVPVENGDTEDHVRRNVMRAKEYDISDAPNSHTPIYDNPSDYRICIVNQTYNDLNRSYERTTASQMEANFKSCGFNNIRLVNGSDFGKEFINNDIYNYDIILMATHGEYDGQRHWIYSGKEYLVTDDINLENPWTEMERLLIDEKLQVINSPNCISCGFVEELREIRGEKKTVLVCYAKVSELGFAKGNNKFRGNGTAVLFNVACQSLEENYALPNVWGKKGLGYYLGYTHSNSIGWRACMEFTEFLLNGYDVIKSKKLMSLNNVSERIDEYDRYGNLYYVTSNLVGLTKKYLGEYHTCIVKPLTLDAKSPFDGVLYGEIRQFDPTKTNFIYGFCTSKHKDMKSSTIHNGIKIDQCKYESSSHMVSFNINLSDDESLEAGPTYFCAYVWDGENYCFGDVKQFEEREMSILKATNVTNNSAVLRAYIVIDNEIRQEYPDACICFYLTDGGDGEYIEVGYLKNIPNGIFEKKVTGLKSFTKYYYLLGLLTNGTEDPYFFEKYEVFSTMMDSQSHHVESRVTNVSFHNADIEACLKDNQTNTGYNTYNEEMICYYSENSFTDKSSKSVKMSRPRTSAVILGGDHGYTCTIPNMKRGQTYYVRICYKADNSKEIFGDQMVIRTTDVETGKSEVVNEYGDEYVCLYLKHIVDEDDSQYHNDGTPFIKISETRNDLSEKNIPDYYSSYDIYLENYKTDGDYCIFKIPLDELQKDTNVDYYYVAGIEHHRYWAGEGRSIITGDIKRFTVKAKEKDD